VCVCVGKGKPLLCMLGNCLNKDPCHMWVVLVVKWWTMNKTNTNAYIGNNFFFEVAHFIRHYNIGCGVSSACDDQIKKGWKSCWFNLG
jgi:hypothetical protein